MRDPLTLLIAGVFGSTLMLHPTASAGLLWDLPQFLGYLGFALLLYGFIDPGLGPRQRLHRHCGYAATVAIGVHALWLLFSDPQILYYLSWDAPAYMLAGLSAMVLLGVAIITALQPVKAWLAQSPEPFRRSHQWLTLGVVLCSLWHLLGSGLYLSGTEVIVLSLGTAFVLLLHTSGTRLRPRADYRTVLPGIGLLLLILATKALNDA